MKKPAKKKETAMGKALKVLKQQKPKTETGWVKVSDVELALRRQRLLRGSK